MPGDHAIAFLHFDARVKRPPDVRQRHSRGIDLAQLHFRGRLLVHIKHQGIARLTAKARVTYATRKIIRMALSSRQLESTQPQSAFEPLRDR